MSWPQAGPRQRHHDLPENAEARRPVELRILQFDRQIGEEVMHQPDDNRQVCHRKKQDQRQMRIQKTHRLEHHIKRHHNNNGRIGCEIIQKRMSPLPSDILK